MCIRSRRPAVWGPRPYAHRLHDRLLSDDHLMKRTFGHVTSLSLHANAVYVIRAQQQDGCDAHGERPSHDSFSEQTSNIFVL